MTTLSATNEQGRRRSPEAHSARGAVAEPPSRYGDPNVLQRIAALKTMDISGLKANWRELFDAEPPVFNRKYLETRLAYRIQELAFGGLKPETVRRIEALVDDLDRGGGALRRRDGDRPIAGTRLVREWQGTEHCVTVTDSGYEYEGRPYKSLSAVARAITGTRWNGWLFFGLKSTRGRVLA